MLEWCPGFVELLSDLHHLNQRSHSSMWIVIRIEGGKAGATQRWNLVMHLAHFCSPVPAVLVNEHCLRSTEHCLHGAFTGLGLTNGE